VTIANTRPHSAPVPRQRALRIGSKAVGSRLTTPLLEDPERVPHGLARILVLTRLHDLLDEGVLLGCQADVLSRHCFRILRLSEHHVWQSLPTIRPAVHDERRAGYCQQPRQKIPRQPLVVGQLPQRRQMVISKSDQMDIANDH
jgi:hypothetical protein